MAKAEPSMAAMGQNAKYSARANNFRIAPMTDIIKHERHVGKVPQPDSCPRQTA
jgi:hypothetical protein